MSIYADYLIVGQGLAGSMLALNLLEKGASCIIVDDFKASALDKLGRHIVSRKTSEMSKSKAFISKGINLYPGIKKNFNISLHSNRVIGGLISPITGKRLVKTWMADLLLPFAHSYYSALEEKLNSPFYTPFPIVRIFANAKQANDWSVHSSEQDYQNYSDSNYLFENKNFEMPYGYTVFKNGAIVDGANFLKNMKTYITKQGLLKTENIPIEELEIKADHIKYKSIRAKNVIFCDGWRAINNPYFKWLPFQPSKGELLVVKSEQLKLKEIINRGIFIRPLIDDFYLIGSTYTWNDLSTKPTDLARNELINKLTTLIKQPFELIEHFAGIRPTVKNRRPFLGRHPQYKNVYIFNGLGTKGLLLAPYFAKHLSEYLIYGNELISDVDINRFISA